MKKQIMLGGLLLLLGSCAPQNKANAPNAIDIAASLEHLTELKISQLGKQIRYIPLETTDSSLIGNSYSIKLSKGRIFVSTNGRCLSFDKQTGNLCAVYYYVCDSPCASDPDQLFSKGKRGDQKEAGEKAVKSKESTFPPCDPGSDLRSFCVRWLLLRTGKQYDEFRKSGCLQLGRIS